MGYAVELKEQGFQMRVDVDDVGGQWAWQILLATS
jgi:hypothetical protein